MRSEAQAVVIGGGVVGCSVLYHLTKLGWRDVLLIERDELTSGSTWHAAGGMHTLNSDPNVAKLQDYTINLYAEIEEVSGQSCGVHLTGGFMVAGTQARLDFLKTSVAKARVLGIESELVGMEEVARRHPLVDTSHFLGAIFDPMEGHVDPSGVTQAYAKSARLGGAEVVRFNPVRDLVRRPDGDWDVVTKNGTVRTPVVINAGGLWAREVGRMVGLELPLLAMEHHYLITEPLAELEALDTEIPHLIDFEAEIYTRQEGKGLLLGTYEQACVPWSPQDTPWDFGHELLPSDLDRIAPSLEVGFRHFPALAEVGIRRTINGPFTFAPDGNPLVGPVRGLPGFYCACGVMAGFSQGGGVGLALSHWIVDGDPGMDVWAMDVSRFGDYATMAYTNAKVQENYRRRFQITYPNEELPAGRPARTTAIYDRLQRAGAVFGVAYGMEHALWFAPEGKAPIEVPSFRRSNAFGPTGEECRAVRNGVGMIEISNFAKYEVTGTGAQAWLSRMLANRMPAEGRLLLTPMLNPNGKLIGDFTLGRLGDDRFLLFGSGPAEGYHMRWFEAHLPDNGVSLRSLGSGLTGLSIAGPRSRDLLARLVREDITSESMPFLSLKHLSVGMVPALVGRISYTGDLGYEIWVEPDYLATLYDTLMTAGAEFGLRLFGARALNGLRLEKSFGAFTREYTPDYSPLEAGLERFVGWRKNDFIGRDAVLRERDAGPSRRLVTLVVEADEADAVGDEPVFQDGRLVGAVTSGGYAHASEVSVALAYVDAAAAGNTYEVEILGEMRPAKSVDRPLFDPDGARMRG